MINIQKILNEQVAKYLKEKLNDSIQNHLSEMMDKVLSNVFSRRWDDNLWKEVERQLKEWLKVNIWQSELLQYNWMVGEAIAAYFKKNIEERNIQPIVSIVDAVVWTPKTWEIRSFEHLISNIKDKITDDIEDDYHRRADDHWKDYPIYATYKKSSGWIEVVLDNEMWERKEKCTIRFLISDTTNTIFSVSHSLKQMALSRFTKVESYINNLYLSQTKIQNIDRNDLDDGNIELDVWSYDPY